MTRTENITFQPKDIPIIDSQWVLRNDGTYLLLYEFSKYDNRYFVLSPLLAAFVALIDGNTSFAELCQKTLRVFSLPDLQTAIDFVESAIGFLNDEHHVISRRDKHNQINQFDTSRYFVPLENYQVPLNSRLALPTHMFLTTTNRCQTNCVYCYADLSSRNKRNLLDFNQWRTIVDYCLDHSILNIDIGGGDPICDKVSVEILLYLLRRGIPQFISTKARFTDSLMRELVEAGLLEEFRRVSSTVQLSIDSTDEKIADFLTGCKNYLQRADNNVKLCLEHGVQPKIKCVLTKWNHQEIVPIVEKYKSMGAEEFQFVYYGKSYYRQRDDLFLDEQDKEAIHAINKAVRSGKYRGLDITIQDELLGAVEEPSVETWAQRARCTGGYSSMTILPDGKVILCEQLPQQDGFIVGNIRETSVKAIWTSRQLSDWLFPPQERFLNTACYNCPEFDACHYHAGFCYRDALFAYDTLFEAPPSCPYQTRIGSRLT